MSLRHSSVIAVLALAGGLFAGAAHAGGHVNWSVNINVPGRVYSEPAYYAPPPVYYEPPRATYYAPPVTYYRPPVVVYRPGPPAIVGGSWRHHHHHHRHDRDDRRGRDEYGDRHHGGRW